MARGVDYGDWSHAETRMHDYQSLCSLEKATQTALVLEEIQQIGVVVASARAETKATGLIRSSTTFNYILMEFDVSFLF